MIYDCFTFFNELELLELRLHELSGVVDRFVLVEATRTFTNKLKPLYFQENRMRFATFEDQIIHIVVHDSPDVSDPWVVERFQRNSIARGLTGCRPEDWILVSDLDEIPRASAIQETTCKNPFINNLAANIAHGTMNSTALQGLLQRRGIKRLWRKSNPFVWRFEQKTFRYFLNCRSSSIRWGTRMARFRDFACAEEMRHSGYKTIPDAGWHFTSMGGVDRILQKRAASAHQESGRPNLSAAQVSHLINTGRHLFRQDQSHEFLALDNSFPQYLRMHPEKFSHLLKRV